VTGHGTLGHTTSGQGPSGDRASEPQRAPRAGPPSRLKKNAQFRNVAKGARFHSRSFSLQAIRRAEAAAEGPRVGFTVTRKTGSAVERNRMRRRLKEALRLAPALCAAPDHDYVVIIRRAALSTPFAELIGELKRAFRDIAGRKGRRTRAAAEQRPAGRATT
jgi:ribonuclease P protein component